MNRRQALALLATFSARPSFSAQLRPTPQHRVSIGGVHGLLLDPNGTLQSWSRSFESKDGNLAENALGLGHNRPIDVHTLYPVPSLSNVATAVGGGSSSFAVLTNGRVFAWGNNVSGVLGITPLAELEQRAQHRASTNTPTPLAVDFKAVDVSSTGDHAMALTADGSVYTWGTGDRGQLGIGPLPVIKFATRSPSAMTYLPFPVQVPNLTGVKAISAGMTHSLALLSDGTVCAWGSNKQGQIGDGTTTDRSTPVAVRGVGNVAAIAAGAYFSVAVLSDGTVMEWGSTYLDVTPRPRPVLIPGARDIRSAVAGLAHVAAVTRAGTIMTWGNSEHYQTGRGRNASPAPAPVSGITGVQSVSANDETTAVVLSSGRIMTWGEVRPWTRPDSGGGDLSPFPILLWLDGLDQS